MSTRGCFDSVFPQLLAVTIFLLLSWDGPWTLVGIAVDVPLGWTLQWHLFSADWQVVSFCVSHYSLHKVDSAVILLKTFLYAFRAGLFFFHAYCLQTWSLQSGTVTLEFQCVPSLLVHLLLDCSSSSSLSSGSIFWPLLDPFCGWYLRQSFVLDSSCFSFPEFQNVFFFSLCWVLLWYLAVPPSSSCVCSQPRVYFLLCF